MFRLIFTCLLFIFYCECKILNPVILVPGDGGSEFVAKLNKTTAPHFWCFRHTDYYFSLWLNLDQLAPFVIDCFTDNMKVLYDREKHVTRNPSGVETKIPGWGDTRTVEWLDPSHNSRTYYFSSIVNAMVKWGYERNVSVRGAPYDFRKAPSDNLDVPFVKALKLRAQQRSMPSTAWLMPSDMFWGKDEVLIERPGRNYTVNEYKQFFMDINFMDGWYMRQDTANLIRLLKPPGVEVHCVHGYGIPTPKTLVYTGNMWPDSQPNVRTELADGTVNIRSLKGCLHWQGKQPQTIYHVPVKYAEHREILKNKDVIAYLKKTLTN